MLRAVASMRQNEAIASSWFCPFLKKQLTEKIIPRKNWIGSGKTSHCVGRWRTKAVTHMLSKSKACHKQWAIAMKNSIQTYRLFYSFCWLFQLAPVHERVPSSHWEGFEPGPEQARLMLNGLALAYIHKPTDFDSRMGWINDGQKTLTFLTVNGGVYYS